MVQSRFTSTTLNFIFLLTTFASYCQTQQWSINPYLPLTQPTSFYKKDSIATQKMPTSWFKRKFFHEHLLIHKDTDLVLLANPILDERLSTSLPDAYFQNTRGFWLFANYKDRLLIQSEFYETQSTFPFFINSWLEKRKIIPGAVEFKPFKENGVDFGVVFTKLSLMLHPHLNYFLAYDKVQLSPGMHNLWISDASMPFPQTGLSFKTDKLFVQYALATFFNPDFTGTLNVPGSQEMNAHQQKWASYHFMTYTPFPFLTGYVFESIVIPPNDLEGSFLKYVYLLPFPGLRLITAPDSTYGKLIGTGWKARWKNIGCYNTYAFSRKGKGITSQIGIDYLFQGKLVDVFVGLEYSQANRIAYTATHVWTGWHNQDFPLGHPFGNDFKEFLGKTFWQHKRWYAFFQASSFHQHLSHRSFLYPLPDSLFERVDRGISLKAEIGYMLNPSSRFAIFLLPWWQQWKGENSKNIFWIQAGLAHRIRYDWLQYW